VSSSPHVDLRDIHKHFGGVHAVRGVSLSCERGQILGLVGENGAGKSTIGKVLAGLVRPDSGRVLVGGEEQRFREPRDALNAGIAIITQELAIVPRRSVVENVFLGREDRRLGLVVDAAAVGRRYAELAELTGFDIPSDTKAGDLPVAQQLRVEIMRALARNANVIVMDEVTAALTMDESARLFEIIRTLRERGTTVVYISHFLKEVLVLCDDVMVMRDGLLVKRSSAAAETPDSLVTAMVGRSLELTFPPKRELPNDAPVVCEVKGLRRARIVNDVSLSVRAGEIVGVAGLIGSGRSEFARVLFGADRSDGGTVEMLGESVRIKSPGDAVRAGMAMVPESRKDQGLMMRRSIVENVSLPHLRGVSRAGVIDGAREKDEVSDMARQLDVRTSSLKALVGTLSGGNQQKVLFARWLLRTPRLLIADEPTRGVDVGAKQEIYKLIASLAAEGLGVLLISSELEEVIGLSHRVLVMREGRLVAEFAGDAVDQGSVMRAAFGHGAKVAA
jgi:simple sugar transport system ATP-binding protein/ribose transport system ATP-binding protein